VNFSLCLLVTDNLFFVLNSLKHCWVNLLCGGFYVILECLLRDRCPTLCQFQLRFHMYASFQRQYEDILHGRLIILMSFCSKFNRVYVYQ